MWYIAFLLFAQQPEKEQKQIKCESCNVLFEAESALEVYGKAVAWAEDYATNNLFKFVGVEHILTVGNERPTDGTELSGMFFDDDNVWERRDKLIPKKEEIPPIIWEENQDTPIGEMMTEKQKHDLKVIFGKK
jgi:hypothetical protein